MDEKEKQRIIDEIRANMVEVVVNETCPAYKATRDNVPQENFKLPEKFFISRYQVTQKQWETIMGNNPSHFKGKDLPVEQVSWNGINNEKDEFLKKLNALTKKDYRLPSEAEWEYATQGGEKSKDYKYAGSNDIDEVAWYGYKDGIATGKTHDVGLKLPNELGLYDMSGNVWEWCEDWYDASHAYCVLRGGSWSNGAERCRVSNRIINLPDYRNIFVGIRLALSQLKR